MWVVLLFLVFVILVLSVMLVFSYRQLKKETEKVTLEVVHVDPWVYPFGYPGYWWWRGGERTSNSGSIIVGEADRRYESGPWKGRGRR
jgi:hypothetical protein